MGMVDNSKQPALFQLINLFEDFDFVGLRNSKLGGINGEKATGIRLHNRELRVNCSSSSRNYSS